MDDDTHIEEEVHFNSALNEQSRPDDLFTGALFPQAQHFVVAGGNFKSVTNNYASPSPPSDFRRIPLGDLDLLNEIWLDRDTGLVRRQQATGSTRRMYSARVHGSKAKMTVALYEGENAEAEWRRNILQHSKLRHPNIMQIYATANSFGIHAAIFHDDLILATQVMDKYRDSHFQLVNLYRCLYAEFEEAKQYLRTAVGRVPRPDASDLWVRPSTGRVCVGLMVPPLNYGIPNSYFLRAVYFTSPALSILELQEESMIIDSTLLDDYHDICANNLSSWHNFPVSTNTSVQPGAIISCQAGTETEQWTEVAHISNHQVYDGGWRMVMQEAGLVMENGWTRIHSSDIGVLNVDWSIDVADWDLTMRNWLVQANHIFNHLSINSNYKNYVLVYQIVYTLTVSITGTAIPPGYLFLCPLQDLQSDAPNSDGNPDLPAYWSIDPLGAEHLSPEEAEALGFPSLEFTMKFWGYSWDESVYAGLRQFHQRKGYDPYSQDLAKELGYPLYQVTSELQTCFAHVEQVENDACITTDDEPENEEFPSSTECPPELVLKASGSGALPADYRADGGKLSQPMLTWKILVGVQFVLILALSVLWLCTR